jgi:prepilin-type N-terminal cleavage/methylation domain-containing protein
MHTQRRDGFTLIELLVVMGIILFLFGMGVAILPSVYQRWEATNGAQMVQGTFARARQEARRSGRPTGVRMLVQAGTYASDLKFVQQPLDGLNPAQAGPSDYLIPDGAGLPAKAGTQPIANLRYRVARQPLPIPGEQTVKLPNNVIIDLTRSSVDAQTMGGMTLTGTEPAPSNTPYIDVVFSPGGGLTAANWPGNSVILWVRDQTLLDPTKGSPTLIVIYVRTGFIAAHPVDLTGAPNLVSPYSFCNNPRSSGL